MAKKKKDKGKGKGFLGKAASFLGSIPSVGDVAKKGKKAAKSTAKKAGKAVKSTAKKAGKAVKSTAKKAKKAVKTTAKKAKKAASSAKKKVKKKAKQAKKKLGKVYTKARKTANNLSKSKLIKQVKQAAKKAVLTTKKAVKKAGKQVKAAVKDTKKFMTKVAGKVAHTYTAFKEGGYKSAASAILDFIPVIGNIKAGIEIATGKEMFTKRKLETWERGVGVAAVFGGGLVKGAVRGGKLASGIVAGSKNAPKNSTSVAESLDGKTPQSKPPKNNEPDKKQTETKGTGKVFSDEPTTWTATRPKGTNNLILYINEMILIGILFVLLVTKDLLVKQMPKQLKKDLLLN